MTDSPQHEPAVEEALGLPEAEVEHLLTTMGKALRAFNMYQSNNPVFQRFKVGLREAFEAVWRETYEITLHVTEDGFRYGDTVHTVTHGREDLAFAFYKDGIRTLTFLPGFEDEVGRFLDAVTRARQADNEADDLITVLWEEDFDSLQYGYVDLLMEGLAIPDQPLMDLGPLDLSLAAEFAPDEEEAGDAAAGATGEQLAEGISREDFSETLYFLDRSELSALQREVEVEMERDLRVDVLNALFDRLEEPRTERQAEILDILDQLLPLFLSRGDMQNAARVLEELDRLQREAEGLDPTLRDRIERLFVRLSDPDVLGQFVRAVEDGAVSPESEEVSLFFSRLHEQALPILIRFAETAEAEPVRARLSSAIDGLAERYPAAVAELLTSEEPVVVSGAARVAGRVGVAEAIPELEAALEHADRDVRLAVVVALAAIRLNPALQALTKALNDTDRDVRIAAAKGLGDVRFASARDALEAVVEGRRIRDADLTEKMAFFEAYGAVGGNRGVERLDELLNGKGFLGRKNPTEMRACAALGLGRAATAEARKALARAAGDDDPIVRNAVARALGEEVAG